MNSQFHCIFYNASPISFLKIFQISCSRSLMLYTVWHTNNVKNRLLNKHFDTLGIKTNKITVDYVFTPFKRITFKRTANTRFKTSIRFFSYIFNVLSILFLSLTDVQLNTLVKHNNNNLFIFHKN